MQNYFDAIKLPAFAADFHYFRIGREKWELMLTRLAHMGAGLVVVAVPWGFHEIEPGQVDLTGATNPRRDVSGLLKLCAALNLPCLLKPGPYALNSGVLNNGLPLRLAGDSQLPATAVTGWFQAVSKLLVDQQWPDGPVVALQLESDAGQEETPAYSRELTEVKWPIWLRKRYKGIDALNAAYGADYRSVSDVPFPQSPAKEDTPLHQDARAFLAEVQAETHTDYQQALVEAGWQTPIYTSANDAPPELPAIQTHSLLQPDTLPNLKPAKSLLILQHPIQVDPDPVEIGLGPVWAGGAPIRSDGSVRRNFWLVRQFLWSKSLPKTKFNEPLLTVTAKTGGLVTSGQDTTLSLSLAKGARPIVYQLRLSGEVTVNHLIKAARGKLSGPYLIEENGHQTDLVFYVNDATAPLSGFMLEYLKRLLAGQAYTLARCANLLAELGQTLQPEPPHPDAAPSKPARPSSYTLTEARRGLSEADKILRKAIASVGGLEAGFDVMLGRRSADTPEPAPTVPAVNPEIFEGQARETLARAGQVCAKPVAHLKAAADALHATINAPHGFTIEQYQQGNTNAVQVATGVRQSLLEVVAQLRVEMAMEQLPLVTWRVHNQIQQVAENLRWGILRE